MIRLTPKEKAEELYWKFFTYTDSEFNEFHHKYTKECVLIAQRNLLQKLKDLNIYDLFEEEVYKEIEKL